MQAGIIVWRFLTKLDPLQYTPIYSWYDFYKETDDRLYLSSWAIHQPASKRLLENIILIWNAKKRKR